MTNETRHLRMAPPTDADPNAAAGAAIAAWQAVAAALSPIIGQGGVTALFRRSLQVASAERPWLAARPVELAGGDDFTTLHATLSRRSGGEAEAGQAALMATFIGLLTSLIGASLAERLLAPPAPAGDDHDHGDHRHSEPRP